MGGFYFAMGNVKIQSLNIDKIQVMAIIPIELVI
jgi:hypothetical protein